jgi:DNA polymerase III alpha subunit
MSDKPVSVKVKEANKELGSATISNLQLSSDERAALSKLIESGALDKLSKNEREVLAKKKLLVNAGSAEAFIARFDISIVRID